MKIKNIIGAATLGLAVLTGASAINAQETQTRPEAGHKTEKHWKKHGEGFRRGGHHRAGQMRKFAQLDLTEAQKEQMRQIHERYRESHRALFEQMRALKNSDDQTARQNLRAQIKEAHKQMRGELLNVLTVEQKTQLEELRKQRRQQFEQRRKQRQAETPVVS